MTQVIAFLGALILSVSLLGCEEEDWQRCGHDTARFEHWDSQGDDLDRTDLNRASYLVTLEEGTTLEQATELLGVAPHRYHALFAIAEVIQEQDDAQSVVAWLSRPGIMSVEPVSKVSALTKNDCRIAFPNLKQTRPWGIGRVRANDSWFLSRGAGVKVAIIDTGIDQNHTDLVARVKGGINFTSGDENDWMDRNGHGTHVAGTVAATDDSSGVVGVAPSSELFAVKVLGDEGSGSDADVISGIHWAAENKMDVINMSLGRSGSSTFAYERALRIATEKGVVVVAAAGNDGHEENKPHYPAHSKYAVSVGAIDSSNRLAYFSNTVSGTELVAPGVSVLSSTPDEGFACYAGTSMATPHVAGVFSLLKHHFPNLSVDDYRRKARCSAVDLGEPGIDAETGHGLVDVYAALTSNASCDDDPESPTDPFESHIDEFYGKIISEGQRSGVLVHLKLTSAGNSISNASFNLKALSTQSNRAIHGITLKTNRDGTAEAFLSGVTCGSITFDVEQFLHEDGTTLDPSGNRRLTVLFP